MKVLHAVLLCCIFTVLDAYLVPQRASLRKNQPWKDIIDQRNILDLRMVFNKITNDAEEGLGVGDHLIDMVKEIVPKVLGSDAIRKEGMQMIKEFLDKVGTKIPQKLKDYLQPLVGRTQAKTDTDDEDWQDFIDKRNFLDLQMAFNRIKSDVEEGLGVEDFLIDMVKRIVPKVLGHSLREQGLNLIKNFLDTVGSKLPQELKNYLEPLVGRTQAKTVSHTDDWQDFIDKRNYLDLQMAFNRIKSDVEEGLGVEDFLIDMVKRIVPKVLGHSLREQGLDLIKKFLDAVGSKLPQELKNYLEPLVGRTQAKTISCNDSWQDIIDKKNFMDLRMVLNVILDSVESGLGVQEHMIDMVKRIAPKVLGSDSYREAGIVMIKKFLDNVGTRIPSQLKDYLDSLVN